MSEEIVTCLARLPCTVDALRSGTLSIVSPVDPGAKVCGIVPMVGCLT